MASEGAVVPVVGKGLGVIATRDIARGECVVAETPLIIRTVFYIQIWLCFCFCDRFLQGFCEGFCRSSAEVSVEALFEAMLAN